MIRQRTLRDCGIASLAIFLADRIARHVDPDMRGLNGLYNRDLVAAAQLLGIRMTAVRSFDLDTDEGLLRVRWKTPRRRQDAPDGHFVTVLSGVIHDPAADTAPLPWRDYVARYDARPCTLLRVTA